MIEEWKVIESIKANEIINNLTKLSKESYEIKIAEFEKYEQEGNLINSNILDLESEIDTLINEINVSIFITFDKNKILSFIKELQEAKELPFEKMKAVFDNISKATENDKVKIGSIYEGGVVFYIDETGYQDLVLAEKDFGIPLEFFHNETGAPWGMNGLLVGADGYGIADGTGMKNTKKIVELASWHFEKKWFNTTKTPLSTAARLCLESNYNGYNDWYLPTINELKLIYDVLKNSRIVFFEDKRYWSSSEVQSINSGEAYFLNFTNGKIGSDWELAGRSPGIKDNNHNVLGVRFFSHNIFSNSEKVPILSSRPLNVTNLHAIAFLYLTMASEDGQITETEALLLVQRLYDYNPENIEFSDQVIEEASNWYHSCTDMNELAIICNELVDGLSSLSEEMKLAILKDLEEISQADGLIHNHERELYNYILAAFR